MKAAAFVLVVLAGCTSPAMRWADPGSLQSATLVEACPLGVPGTRLRAGETGDGIEVLFTTRASNVEELRLRVRDQGRVHGPERHRGRGHFGEHGGARDHGLRLWALPPIRTSVEDIAGGAKLVIAPVDPAHRDDVRRAVSERVGSIAAADCF
jgi:hypothetical protein